MRERGKAVEGGLIECQTCEKKNSLNLILSNNLNYFHHFQPFLYYKKCARLKEVIRRDFDQCGVLIHLIHCVQLILFGIGCDTFISFMFIGLKYYVK